MSRTKLFSLVGLVVIASMVLTSCAAPQVTPQAPQVVKETVVVAGTPQVIEKVVTQTPPPPKQFAAKDKTLTEVNIGGPDTLDPALDYETAGAEVLQNVYETLVFYNKDKPTEFVPQLATEVPTTQNGGISADGKTYTFKIRKGVKFHNGDDMTPDDVAYSFQRGLLQGSTSSPQWLISEALLGASIDDVAQLVNPDVTDDPAKLKAEPADKLLAACQKVQAAVVADNAAGTVTFKLAQPWAPFIPTIANTWGSAMNKKWTIANGGWDGDCKTWQNFYGATSDQINKTKIGSAPMGTGAFKFDHWTPGTGGEVVLVRNDNYWRTDPAWPGGPTGPAALDKVVIKSVDEFGTRLSMAQAGDADYIYVPLQYVSQLDPLVGEECDLQGKCTPTKNPDAPLRLYKGLPAVNRTDVFFNFKINVEGGNPYVGSGKLDGNGIPPNFFSDIHIRKAFNYCFDWDAYISAAQNGEGIQSTGVILPGLIGYEDKGAHYSFDKAKCEEEFKASTLKSADGKSLWDVGFRLQATYNTGNDARLKLGQILASNLGAVNPKFQVEIIGLPWATFLAAQRAKTLPLFFVGWLEDIHDPHNWVVPYLGSSGTYALRQSIPADIQSQFQPLIDKGVAETDPAKRADIYHQLNQLVYDNAPGIILSVALNRHYEQRWMKGYFYNPIYTGSPTGMYFYAASK
jgi:peptide/nickel transport system substrate-binding protein